MLSFLITEAHTCKHVLNKEYGSWSSSEELQPALVLKEDVKLNSIHLPKGHTHTQQKAEINYLIG